jgi:hypothetical protein
VEQEIMRKRRHAASQEAANAVRKPADAMIGATMLSRDSQRHHSAGRRSRQVLDWTTAARQILGRASGAACALLILLAPGRGEQAPVPPRTIAVAEFDYTDTSGEVRDQRAEHQARLEAFASEIRRDLARSGKYRIVMLACGQDACPAGRSNPAGLTEVARLSGAALLLHGGIQKISTLIQNAQIQMIDVDAGHVLFERAISFRGDSDEAWQHAERFVVGDLISDAPH